MSAPILTLKPGRERSLLRRHPWVFSGAIGEVQGSPQSGANVEIRAADGAFLAWAAYSPASQIRARVWSFDEADAPGPELFRKKIEAALALRRAAIPAQASDAFRLVHGESDGLPGLVADRYADVLVVQIVSAGCERWREPLIEILRDISGCARVYERSDTEGRGLEGLAPRSGAVSGAGPDGPTRILEHGIKYEVDVVSGQKTGFYLDQRDNRALNGLEAGRAEWLQADVFEALRGLQREGRQFDLVVLDPPKFAPTPKDAARAARGYKDINLNALKLLRPGGLLATFSCSGGVSPELFQKIVAGAAADAGASLVLRERFTAAPDHPVLVEFPEGEYLKGLLLERR